MTFTLYLASSMDTIDRTHSHLGIKNILISFAEISDNNMFQKIQQLKKFRNTVPDAKILLDSGAYSAQYAGKKIDLMKYIQFIRKYRSIFTDVTALDVMSDGKQSIKNYREMLEAGLYDTIPVYHIPENPNDTLYTYLDMGAKYVGIGNIAKDSVRADRTLPRIIKVLKWIPKDVKVHLYGVSNTNILIPIIERIHSSDSTSWMSTNRYGLMCLWNNKMWNFKKIPTKNNLRGVVLYRWMHHAVEEMKKREQFLNEVQARRIQP